MSNLNPGGGASTVPGPIGVAGPTGPAGADLLLTPSVQAVLDGVTDGKVAAAVAPLATTVAVGTAIAEQHAADIAAFDSTTSGLVTAPASATRTALATIFVGQSGTRYADQFPGASVVAKLNAAIADIGAGRGILVIPATMGAGEPAAPYPPHVLILDYRSGVPGSGLRFNTSTVPVGGGVETVISTSGAATDSAGVSLEVGQFQAFSLGTPTGLVTNEALTATSQTLGVFGSADARFALVGFEANAVLNSTGGSLETLRGGTFAVATVVGSTTKASNGSAVHAQGPVLGAAGLIANVYGVKADSQAGGTNRNYSIYSRGGVLFDNSQAISALLPTVTAADGAVSLATPTTLTSVLGAFLTTVKVGSPIKIPGAGPSGVQLLTTVTTVVDDHTLTFLSPATTAVTGVAYAIDGKAVPVIFFGSGADTTFILKTLDDTKGFAFKNQNGITLLQLGGAGTSFGATVAMAGSLTIAGNFSHTGGAVGFYGKAAVAKAAAIATPTTQSTAYVQVDVQSLKTAIDAIRTALTGIGITA